MNAVLFLISASFPLPGVILFLVAFHRYRATPLMILQEMDAISFS